VHAVAVGKQYLSDGIALAFRKLCLVSTAGRARWSALASASATCCVEWSRVHPARKLASSYRCRQDHRYLSGRLMTKLGVPNRSALIRFAIEHELAVL